MMNTLQEISAEQDLPCLQNSLRLLCLKLDVGKDGKKNVASIGQCIIQAVCQRTVTAPLQIGLTVQMHQFRSKSLIESLATL